MRVGIMTFNRAINYGAVLQSYALKKTILRLTDECEVINYKCDNIEKSASPFYIKSKKPKDIIVFLLQIFMRLKKNREFKKFTDRYLDTESCVLNCKSIAQVKNRYDLIVLGSDQIWNYQITGLDANYFGVFAGDKTVKASYAASFGVSKIPESHLDDYTNYLSYIDIISVREPEGTRIVRELTNKNSYQHIDPVFLLSKNEWSHLISDASLMQDYILVYSINKSECYSVAQKLSDLTGLKIVGLQVSLSERTKCKRVQTESPDEFLNWFYHARYVITDSFHGTAFSILFEKKFMVCTGGGAKERLSRQTNLLDILGLSSREYSGDIRLIDHEIDYLTVNRIIQNERSKSIEYLSNVFSVVEKNKEKKIPILFKNKDECCGCSACLSICPVGAITLEPDNEGFLYPSINQNKCICCYRCINVCAFQK